MLQSSETWRCLCLTLKCLKTSFSYQDLTSSGKNQKLVGFKILPKGNIQHEAFSDVGEARNLRLSRNLPQALNF